MREETTERLWTLTRSAVSLAAALGEVGARYPQEMGLIYGAGRRGCVFVRVEAGSLRGHPAAPVPARVFELRAWNGTTELRWLRTEETQGDGEPLGEAVLLVHGENEPRLHGWTPLPGSLAPRGDTRYLLWGIAQAGEGDGWTRLFEHRTGDLWAPCAAAPGQRVVLACREYLGEPDEHGNLTVAAERIVGLTAADIAGLEG